MMITKEKYLKDRSSLLANSSKLLNDLEKKYQHFLLDVIEDNAKVIYLDFCQAGQLLPFWANYAPKQRGRKPKGESVPWSEVGDHSISANLEVAIAKAMPSVRYIGMPFGGDVRFMTDDAIIHCDVKLTGPNDNPDEVVASPNQVSGDGKNWASISNSILPEMDGVVNTKIEIQGKKASSEFQPELPPFYIINDKVLPCLTYFLKGVYKVLAPGDQPIKYLELVCVPNGLQLFEGVNLSKEPGLLIPGKDIKAHKHKRARIRLNPLAQLDPWRCVKIDFTDDGVPRKRSLRVEDPI